MENLIPIQKDMELPMKIWKIMKNVLTTRKYLPIMFMLLILGRHSKKANSLQKT